MNRVLILFLCLRHIVCQYLDTHIHSHLHFTQFANNKGTVLSKALSVKWIIDARDTSTQNHTIHYMNANYNNTTTEHVLYHYSFAQYTYHITHSLQQFSQHTYYTHNKHFYVGSIQLFNVNNSKLYAIQFFPQDVITQHELIHPINIIRNSFMPKESPNIVFVSTGSQQQFDQVVEHLHPLSCLTADDLLGDIVYFPMNLGEAWGYLRLFPTDQDLLTPLDIAVFDELPLHLSVVAGVVTRQYQDPNSHVNLKSRERNTPNMVLRILADLNSLSRFRNKPVHLVVGDTNYSIEESDSASVIAKHREKTSFKKWTVFPVNSSDSRLLLYDEMCPKKASSCLNEIKRSFGSKAANLGFLANIHVLGRMNSFLDQGDDVRSLQFSNLHQGLSLSAGFGYDLSPHGFGIPFHFYLKFINHHLNMDLRKEVESFAFQETNGLLSPADRKDLTLTIKEKFYSAHLPTELLDKILQFITDNFKDNIREFRFRSSANAEDVVGFDGAGLYDSFTGSLDGKDQEYGKCVRIVKFASIYEVRDEMYPKTVNCAIKGVYASLWNQRAVEERSFSRIDHASSAMAISVVPAYYTLGKVSSNAVIVTRVEQSSHLSGYTFSLQLGNNLVTNPAPDTLAEVTTVCTSPDGPASFSTLHYARPYADGQSLGSRILSDSEMARLLWLSSAIERAYCHWSDGLYSEYACEYVSFTPGKRKALDMEVRLYEGGRVLMKQVREFNVQ